MINLEVPKKFRAIVSQAHQVGANVFRPISRKYDRSEHAYPVELDMFAAIMDGMNESTGGVAGAGALKQDKEKDEEKITTPISLSLSDIIQKSQNSQEFYYFQ